MLARVGMGMFDWTCTAWHGLEGPIEVPVSIFEPYFFKSVSLILSGAWFSFIIFHP